MRLRTAVLNIICVYLIFFYCNRIFHTHPQQEKKYEK